MFVYYIHLFALNILSAYKKRLMTYSLVLLLEVIGGSGGGTSISSIRILPLLFIYFLIHCFTWTYIAYKFKARQAELAHKLLFKIDGCSSAMCALFACLQFSRNQTKHRKKWGLQV